MYSNFDSGLLVAEHRYELLLQRAAQQRNLHLVTAVDNDGVLTLWLHHSLGRMGEILKDLGEHMMAYDAHRVVERKSVRF